ncbi:DUF493 domain-containing protein [Helicobacter sp. MIT 05-5294]|uniref:HP0495 family protein n=1 Tax=Helicobacter sp. MIT 05-5294 TaxID=1548150 RepID=UPI00051FD3ED|nr:DUF493 domain-containing protein [Helicobacter sp. MIT 05-5294]TLD87813.1 DUF493 domain-containing protein [Helicobacter sp. MIT 05-5294]
MEEQKIQYPCTWHYRIIGTNKEELRLAALELIDKEILCTPAKESSKGKYHSVNIEVIVENQEERDRIFANLHHDSRIKFVL